MRRSVRTLASEWTAQHAVHMAKDVVSGWVVKVYLPVLNVCLLLLTYYCGNCFSALLKILVSFPLQSLFSLCCAHAYPEIFKICLYIIFLLFLLSCLYLFAG